MDGIAIVTFLLAIATGALAFFAWRSIRQNSEIREKERKERLLKEIIDWGESIRKCSFLPPEEFVLRLTGDDKRRVLALKHESECRIVAVRYTYLKSIASDLDVSVQNAIKEVSNRLASHIALLGLEFEGKTKENDIPDSIDRLKQSVNRMIKVAVRFLPK
jgi:HAMP domain-containing protein